MAKKGCGKHLGTFLAILHKAMEEQCLMCSIFQVTHTGQGLLESSLRESSPFLSWTSYWSDEPGDAQGRGPARGSGANTMSRIHILYLQALREAKQTHSP